MMSLFVLLGILILSIFSVHGIEQQFDETDSKYNSLINLNGTATTNTYAQAINYGKTHPNRDGGSWNGWCAALMFRAGNLPQSSACPSAIDAYHKSKIISLSANSAPSGAFHYWSIGEYGHVAMATTDGWAMMASCHITESWGECIGVTPVATYTSTTGAKYLGWSYDYAGAEIADVHHGPTPTPTSDLPRTTTAENGIPGTNYYHRQQLWASYHGYTGPINGVLGPNSWEGTQRGLQAWGYTGPVNGIPGTNTYMAMQRLASHYGYTGPINGVLGTNSYMGFAKFLNTL